MINYELGLYQIEDTGIEIKNIWKLNKQENE